MTLRNPPVRMLLLLAAAPLALANSDPPKPQAPIPPEVKSMLDAALTNGDDAEIATILKYAQQAAPDSSAAIAALVDGWRKDRESKRETVIREAAFLDLWKGNISIGGYATTGNTDNVGLSAQVDLNREGLRWRQKVHLLGEYQKSFGVTNREHLLASYEPNYKVDDRAYIYGQAQYESDKFLGFYDRFSGSVGAGYSAIKKPKMTLDLELGPAYRSTSFTDDTSENSIAARGSLDFDWRLSPGITFKQDAAAFLQHYNSTVTGTTALNAKLFGPLSAQLSYTVQYESMPPVGSVSTDTTSRASLVYSF